MRAQGRVVRTPPCPDAKERKEVSSLRPKGKVKGGVGYMQNILQENIDGVYQSSKRNGWALVESSII